MGFNMCVGPVRMQMTNTQKINNSETSTKNIPNLHVCYLDKGESKSINGDKSEAHGCYTGERESKRVIINACYSEESESKAFI